MNRSSAWSTPDLLFKSFAAGSRGLCFVLFFAAIVLPLSSAVPSTQRKKSSAKAASRPSKEKSAKRSEVKNVGAAGMIALAQAQLDSHNYSAASEYAKSAASKAPVLADYAHYVQAQAELQLRNYSNVTESATHIFQHAPPSPFVGAAAALAVRADLDGDRPKEALQLIKKYFSVIPQPEGSFLLARSFQATGDLPQAAEYFNRVYYDYPASKESAEAGASLADLKSKLGDAFPPPMPRDLIGRAQKLFDARNPSAAKIELAAAIPQLTGAELDVARVRLGVADFLAGNARAAFEYLVSLKVNDPEADAERLDYIIRAARKNDRKSDVKLYLDQLESQHPSSTFRLDAVVFAGDQARIDHDPATYIPLYRACAATFPNDKRAAWCHWRLAFESYWKDAADAYDLLRSHVQVYPKSEDINNALYFLGRVAERKNDNASAHACYEELEARFPNTYYALQAANRLEQSAVKAAVPSVEMRQFLQEVSWAPRPEFPSFEPGALARIRIQRAGLLRLTGLTAFAEGELKFGAANDGAQQNYYAYELGKLADARKAPDQALRYIKRYAPGYLYMPFDQAPLGFWRMAFPMSFRSSIDVRSKQQNLDPFFVAALIRQESEFNPAVISHANAYGLMQVLPSTGKQLARRLGIKRFSSAQLLTSDRNVQLGTLYVRDLMNSFNGREEYVLASYNAGPGRARLWDTWGPFREQAEFIENIPFHETRNYVQVVLRNAEVYRRLYAGTRPEIPVYQPKPAPVTKVKPKVKPKTKLPVTSQSSGRRKR